jgi:hypothetical protein
MGAVLQGAVVALAVVEASVFLLRRYWPGRPGCGHAEGGGCHCGRDD